MTIKYCPKKNRVNRHKQNLAKIESKERTAVTKVIHFMVNSILKNLVFSPIFCLTILFSDNFH